MASDGPPNDKKKDLTGIFSIPPTPDQSQDLSSYAEPKTESVDSFDAIAPTHTPPEAPTHTGNTAINDTFAQQSDFQQSDFPPTMETPEPLVATALDPLDDLSQYSQSIQGTSQLVSVFVPYHLYLNGTFGPYERDKLLLFITENEIGLSSQDLDLQIRSGKVFFPRISEFAGIKLIQELRDSGLQFRFIPSDRNTDESAYQTVHPTAGQTVHFNAATTAAAPATLPVIPEGAKNLNEYQEIDTLQITQYLKAEIVEMEKSDVFQEIVERMIESLKQKARIKGGDALFKVEQKITPLRLPSQYQVWVQATVLKKRYS